MCIYDVDIGVSFVSIKCSFDSGLVVLGYPNGPKRKRSTAIIFPGNGPRHVCRDGRDTQAV